MKIKFSSKYLITICICTYNRNAGLLELLKSINKIKLPNNIDFSKINVVVVDNFKGKSKEIIKQNLFDFNNHNKEWLKGSCLKNQPSTINNL